MGWRHLTGLAALVFTASAHSPSPLPEPPLRPYFYSVASASQRAGDLYVLKLTPQNGASVHATVAIHTTPTTVDTVPIPLTTRDGVAYGLFSTHYRAPAHTIDVFVDGVRATGEQFHDVYSIPVAARSFRESILPSTIQRGDATTAADRAQAARARIAFDNSWRAITAEDGFLAGYAVPFTSCDASSFGARRFRAGVELAPHRGVDCPEPTGTPIHAPLDGVVTLASDDLFYEGEAFIVRAGPNLYYGGMHGDNQVHVGDTVHRGDVIAHVNQKGRASGPHLHWIAKITLPGGRTLDVDPLSLRVLQ